MSDDRNETTPPEAQAESVEDAELDPEFFTPELLREIHKLRDRLHLEEPPTADEHGNPLPRLEMGLRANPTEDPLLNVGYALRDHLPDGWKSATLLVSAAAEEVRTSATVDVPGATPSDRWFYFGDLADVCLTLRRSMYKGDGQGVWYNVTIQLYQDGTLRPFFDSLTPPFMCWGPGEVDLVLRDHELYPRDPEHLPHWHPARW